VSIRKLKFLLGFDYKDLKKIAEKVGHYYKPFDIQKKPNGKWRHIDNPIDTLKIIQRRIRKTIITKVHLPITMIGGIAGKSIKDNALPHINQPMVVTLDLKNCFPKTHFKKIFQIYVEIFGCSDKIAKVLTKLTTIQTRLPQGAPTSTDLVNLALLPLHNDIKELLQRDNLKWSFYIDDITMSGQDAEKAIGPGIQIIQKHGYAVSHKKIKVMPQHIRQEIMGLTINKKISISRDKIQSIRREIIELGNKKHILDTRLQSLRGKVSHVKNICLLRGISLEKLYKKYLPAIGLQGKKEETFKIRRCKCAKRHLYE